MKKLAVKKNIECMACLECVRACSTAFYKEFHQDLSCIQVVAKGTGAKPMTCIECGIAPNQVDTTAIAEGYRLAFPENAERLNKWLLGADEYRYW